MVFISKSFSKNFYGRDGFKLVGINFSPMLDCWMIIPIIYTHKQNGKGKKLAELAVLYPPQVIPYGFHRMADGFHKIADGFHGMVHGFHTIFRVESIWNPYGMSSWNHNSTLVSYHFQGGFHME